MQKRKLQSMGRTSDGISLPRKWLRQAEKNMGKPVTGVFQETIDGKLVFTPCFEQFKRKNGKTQETIETRVSKAKKPKPPPLPVKVWECECSKKFNSFEEWQTHADAEMHLNFTIKEEVPK